MFGHNKRDPVVKTLKEYRKINLIMFEVFKDSGDVMPEMLEIMARAYRYDQHNGRSEQLPAVLDEMIRGYIDGIKERE